MPPRKSSTNDIDELLKLAEQPTVVKTKSNPEIDKFILECKIVPGTKRIATYIIYYRYCIWKKTRRISRRKFFNYFKTKFTKTRTDDGVGYLLSPKGFDLSPISFFKARAHLRKEKDEKKAKVEKK